MPRVKDGPKWINALFSVLNSRIAPIKKLSIAADILHRHKHDFCVIFSGICPTGLEELLIRDTDFGGCYVVPLPVFACNTITKLEIDSCRLTIPSKLTGLLSVKSLLLKTVEVADDDLQRMISQCKASEKLVITDCLKVKNIVICAPNLSQLVINLCRLVGIMLRSVRRLASVSFSFDDEDCIGSCIECYSKKSFEAANLISFLNGLCGVKDLRLDFSSEYRMSDTLVQEDEYCQKAMELNFWEKQLPAECVKHHLTTATFYLEYILEDCFFFPKFLLLNAGNLKSMNIYMLFYNKEPETVSKAEENIKNKVLAIQLASPDVEIMIKPIDWYNRYKSYKSQF